jgi:HEAT repeat protein
MKTAAFLALALVLFSVRAGAADTADQRAQTRRTLLYGIDSQVLDAVTRLKESRNTEFTAELESVLEASPNPALRAAILDLFTEQKAREAESTARAIVMEWQDGRSELVTTAIRYLSVIQAADMASALLPVMEASDQGIAAAAIDAIGKTQDRSATKGLLDKLARPDFPDSRKAGLILALGEMRDPAAVDALSAIARNGDEERVRRMYAADALGKIGDEKAIPVLKTLLGESDALVRAYASTALSGFSVESVLNELMQGLRDENWRVRVQCAKALGKPLPAGRVQAVIDMLAFKAEMDPVSQVRLESMRALGGIGGDAAFDVLRGIYKGNRNPLESRETALGVLAEKAMSQATAETVKAALADAAAGKDQRILVSTAKVLSTASGAALEPVYAGMLESADAYVRTYAVRGAAVNRLSGLRGRIQALSEKDPNPMVQREAKAALEKL